MAYSNLQLIDKVVLTYRCHIDAEKYSKLLCGLCSHIMKNPAVTTCGCSFCMDCILTYLGDKDQYCPGSNEYCKSEYLVRFRDVHQDPRTHRLIGQILVRCPNEQCDHQTTLGCPFVGLGCTEGDITPSGMGEHLAQDGYDHSNMMVKCMNEIRAEIASMKIDFDVQMADQRSFYDREIKRQADKMTVLKEALAVQGIKTSEISHNADIRGGELREEIGNIAEDTNTIRNVLEKRKAEVEIVTWKDNELDMNEENEEKENMECIHLMKSQILALAVENGYTKSEISVMKKDAKNKIDKLRFGKFIWKIDNFSQKLEEAVRGEKEYLWSDYFYSHQNGYKLRLQLYPNGFNDNKGTHLSIFFRFYKGEYDGVLKWPKPGKIQIHVINQDVKLSVKYDFSHDTATTANKPVYMRPKTEKGIGLGYDFIELKKLRNVPGYICDDAVYIMCQCC